MSLSSCPARRAIFPAFCQLRRASEVRRGRGELLSAGTSALARGRGVVSERYCASFTAYSIFWLVRPPSPGSHCIALHHIESIWRRKSSIPRPIASKDPGSGRVAGVAPGDLDTFVAASGPRRIPDAVMRPVLQPRRRHYSCRSHAVDGLGGSVWLTLSAEAALSSTVEVLAWFWRGSTNPKRASGRCHDWTRRDGDGRNIYVTFLQYNTGSFISSQDFSNGAPAHDPNLPWSQRSCPRILGAPNAREARGFFFPHLLHYHELDLVYPGRRRSLPGPNRMLVGFMPVLCRFTALVSHFNLHSNLWPWIRMRMPTDVRRIWRIPWSIHGVHGQHLQVRSYRCI